MLSALGNEYGRKTHTIQVDFTEGGGIYSSIAKELQGLQIGILGNTEKTHTKCIIQHYAPSLNILN